MIEGREEIADSIYSESTTYVNSFSYQLNDRGKDQTLSLNWKCESPSSFRMRDSLICIISQLEGWKGKPRDAMKKAAGAYIFGLLSLPYQAGTKWLYRPLSLDSFTGKSVGYKPFMRLHNGLINAGMIEVKPGYFERDENGKGSGLVTPRSSETTLPLILCGLWAYPLELPTAFQVRKGPGC